MPKEYIDRAVVINDIDNIIKILKNPPIGTIDKKLLETFELWKQRFLQTPTADVVEVVRCKDCKSCLPHNNQTCICDRTGRLIRTKDRNSYCSYGKRKESEVEGE